MQCVLCAMCDYIEDQRSLWRDCGIEIRHSATLYASAFMIHIMKRINLYFHDHLTIAVKQFVIQSPICVDATINAKQIYMLRNEGLWCFRQALNSSNFLMQLRHQHYFICVVDSIRLYELHYQGWWHAGPIMLHSNRIHLLSWFYTKKLSTGFFFWPVIITVCSSLWHYILSILTPRKVIQSTNKN